MNICLIATVRVTGMNLTHDGLLTGHKVCEDMFCLQPLFCERGLWIYSIRLYLIILLKPLFCIVLQFKVQIHYTALFQKLESHCRCQTLLLQRSLLSQCFGRKIRQKREKGQGQQGEKQTRTLFHCFHRQEQRSKLQYR